MRRHPVASWALVACAVVCSLAHAEDDISPEGPCKAALTRLCAQVEPGPGAKAFCLRDQARAARERKEEPLPPACVRTLHRFFVNASQSGNLTLRVSGFEGACAADISRVCPDKKAGELVSCLETARGKHDLSERCSERVFMMMRHEAQHIELDNDVSTACKEELKSIPACAGLPELAKPGEKKACLIDNRRSASPRCRDALFHRMQHDLADVRLNQRVFSKCRTEISKLCGSLEYGEARILKCLWEKRNSGDYSQRCKDIVKATVQYKAQDYRLDQTIRTRCKEDISTLCAKEQLQVDHLHADELFGDDWREGKSGVVLQCLKANFTKISDSGCRREIKALVRVHAGAAVADPIFARHCRTDVSRSCNKTGPERLHLCLRAHWDELGPKCRQVELIQGSLASMDISMKPAMQTACVRDIPKFCRGVAQGDAQVIQCLQDHMEEEEMSSKCSEVVKADLEASNHDWRLKWGLHHNCMVDAGKLCSHAVPQAAGAVIACLKANESAITSSSCRSEMFHFMRQGFENIKFAPQTYSSCVSDVQRFCKDVVPGQGRVHECLVKNRTMLSEACAKAEFQTHEIMGKDMRIDPFWPLCFKSVMKLCHGVQAGSGRIWDCIANAKDNPDVEPACRQHVSTHTYVQNTEFYLNPQLVTHCVEDAKRLCPHEHALAEKKDFSSEGSLISCLIRERSNVKMADCKVRLRMKALERLQNIENDPQAFWGCKEDIKNICSSEYKHNQNQGMVHTCLQKHLLNLSYTCQLVEFEYMTMQMEDARMNLFVYKECKAATKRYCDDTLPGKGQQIVCMLRHMHESSMEAECRGKLKKLQRLRASSLIFNPQLATSCKEDLAKIQKRHSTDPMCKPRENQDLVLNSAGLTCLTTHHNESKGITCKTAIRNMLSQQSYDLRAVPGLLYNFCNDDIKKLCAGVDPGNGRWHTCMRKNRDKIKDRSCKQVIQKVLSNERKDVLLNPGVRQRCANELKAFCRNIQRGASRNFICLKQHAKEVGFSSSCQQALDELGMNATISVAAEPVSTSVLKSFLDYKSFWDKWGLALIGGVTILLVLWIIGIIAVIRRLRKGKGLYGVQIDHPAEVVGAEQEKA